jgi:hypothetical protein
MALKNSELRKITGLYSLEIIKCLEAKGIIRIIDKDNFEFIDSSLNINIVALSFNDKLHTKWKYESKKYLIDIAQDCRKILNFHIKTSYINPSFLPFIKYRQYIINITKLGSKYMCFSSELGKFKTYRLGGKRIVLGKYILITNSRITLLISFNNKEIIKWCHWYGSRNNKKYAL